MSRTVATSTTAAGLTTTTAGIDSSQLGNYGHEGASNVATSQQHERHQLHVTINTNVGNDNDETANSNEDDEKREPRRCDGMCIELVRCTILLLGLVAVALSVLTVLSCSFFERQQLLPSERIGSGINNVDGIDTDLGNDSVISAIGLFSFQAKDVTLDSSSSFLFDFDVNDLTGQTCQSYDGKLLQSSSWMGPMWIVAQFSSIIAPSLGFVAWLITLCETVLIGPFYGSFLLPILLLILACLVQGCTFMMLGEADVCFNDDNGTGGDGGSGGSDGILLSSSSCQLSYGAFMSISSSFLYYLISVVLCCLPRPTDPWCCSRRGKHRENLEFENSNDDNESDGGGSIHGERDAADTSGGDKDNTNASSSDSSSSDIGTSTFDEENPSTNRTLSNGYYQK